MGRAGAPPGGAALEFPQIPGWTRRLSEGGLYVGARADRPAHCRRDRKGIGARIVASARAEHVRMVVGTYRARAHGRVTFLKNSIDESVRPMADWMADWH